jgi:hypothetical protein
MPPNSYDLSLEYARADFNQRHRLELFGSISVWNDLTLGISASARSGRPYSDHRRRRVQHRGGKCTSRGRAAQQPDWPGDGVGRRAPVEAFDLPGGGGTRSVGAGIDALSTSSTA